MTRVKIPVASEGEPVFEDININPVQLIIPGPGDLPDPITIPGTDIDIAGFDPSTEESIRSGFEVLHAVKLGTVLSFHVHWCPTNADTGDVRWGLEYGFARDDAGGAFSSSTIYVLDAGSGTAWQRQTVSFADITPPASELGLQFGFRFFRDATDLTDDYTGDAGIMFSIGAHVEYDGAGSETISSK